MSDRITEALQRKNGGNQSELARFVGVSPQAVQKWVAGESEPRGDNLLKAAEFLAVSPAYLKFGTDENVIDVQAKFIEDPLALGQSKATYNVTSGPVLHGDVPVISWITAGTWALVSDPYEPGLASNWLPCPKSHSKRTFALRVRGVSMENLGGKYSYSDGDVIFVDPERHPENGSRIIVRLDESNEATFKQLVIEGDKKYLKALNPAWPDKIIEINGNATICGVVIGKWTDE